MKHFPSFTECIQHTRKTWIRRGRPARTVRKKSSNMEAFKKWKVYFKPLTFEFVIYVTPMGVHPWVTIMLLVIDRNT